MTLVSRPIVHPFGNMQHTVVFKGKFIDDKYHWENTADASPKQLYSYKNDVIAQAFPKVNQRYIVRYSRLNVDIMIDIYEVIPQFDTCSYWKVIKGEFIFKKTENKGLTLTQYASCFKYNPEEEAAFMKRMVGMYKKTLNPYTKSNIIFVLNKLIDEGTMTYCELFGKSGSHVFISGKFNKIDITEVTLKQYPQVYKYLDWCTNNFLNPITKSNCQHWMKYLKHKFD